MTQEEKAKAYDEALKKAKQFHNKELYAECNGNLVEYIFPELAESEDEKIRKAIISVLEQNIRAGFDHSNGFKFTEIIAWLEEQKDINSKEYVFRPHLGCNINTAAIQAVAQQKLGNKIVLAFNGAYIPVEGKTANEIINEYYSWLEKQDQKAIKEALRAEYDKGRADAFAEIYQPAQSESAKTFNKEEILNEISEREEDINRIAEKLSKGHRKYREGCGINDPIMLDEIEEAYYNGFLSGVRAIKFNVYENSNKGWSEEDEDMKNSILKLLLDEQMTAFVERYKNYLYKEIDWLESLKKRLGGQ